MRKQRKQPEGQKKSGILYIVLSVMLLVMLAAAVLAGRRHSETASVEEPPAASEEGSIQEKWQEGTITYDGKYYKYDSNLRTYLLMGIDKEGPVTEAEDSVSGGQSDAMFLIVTDAGRKSVSVISINRNTMTKIETSDAYGMNRSETTAQICTQHGFGDGKHYSCSRTVDAVSYLFYNIPVSGYLSINMGAVPILNDAVGGVEVTVLRNLQYPERGVDLREGETVTLNGTEAYSYLRGRDINEFDSATDRLRRQEQYIANFMTKLKTAVAGDPGKAADLYNSVSEYVVTNVDFVNLLSELITYEFDENGMYTVPGKTVMGEKFEEYYADDDALYDLIIQIFYREVE